MGKTVSQIKSLTLEEAHALLVEGKAYCYFKRVTHNAESGYPAMEWGYCQIGDDFRVVAKHTIGRLADVLELRDPFDWKYDRNYTGNKGLLMDVTRDGYYRIISSYRWDEHYPDIGSAELKFPPKEQEIG